MNAERGPSQADELTRMGMEMYEYIQHGGAPYAVPSTGWGHALPLRAQGRGNGVSVRAHLIRRYYAETQKAPGQGAIADAISTLAAAAMDAPEMPVHLRVAPDPKDSEVTWLDLGRADGQSVKIGAGGWETVAPAGALGEIPLWRRTRLTGELPLPARPAAGWQPALERLRELMPVTDETWPMAVASLLAALQPDMPRPLVYFTGEQGTGKSTAGRMVLRLLEGPTADLRSMPRDEDDLAVVAAAGWTLALDNASGIPAWMSDALCRIVTGATSAKRELFSDDDVSLIAYMRPTLLTGIDVGALRGDLAERMLRVELTPMTTGQRRSERDLWTAYRKMLPGVLGGLLELAALVWAELPAAREQLTERPRMADFAELLWALDRVTGWSALRQYLGEQDDLVDDVLDADPVASSLIAWAKLAESSQRPGTTWAWHGSAEELLQSLSDYRGRDRIMDDKHWPKTGQVLVSRLKRAAPALRKRGIEYSRWRTKAGRGIDLVRNSPVLPAQSTAPAYEQATMH
jgi:hypothetical protein